MNHDHAVYVLAAIGIALEDVAFTKVLTTAIGRIGMVKLHEAEMALAKERNLEPYRPDVRLVG